MSREKNRNFDHSEVDDGSNLPSLEKLLSFIPNVNNNIGNIPEEIKSLQRSFANLRPYIRKIFREELKAALNGGIQR